MGSRGVHFALTDEERGQLLSLSDDDARIDYVKDEIESKWDEKHLQQTDKAWDAIHRCLTDHAPGIEEVDKEAGTYPLKLCVLGGHKILDDETYYVIRLIEPDEVKDLAAALEGIDDQSMTDKYWTHCEGAWPEYGEEDLAYTLDYFDALKFFFKQMASTGRSVIFSVAQ